MTACIIENRGLQVYDIDRAAKQIQNLVEMDLDLLRGDQADDKVSDITYTQGNVLISNCFRYASSALKGREKYPWRSGNAAVEPFEIAYISSSVPMSNCLFFAPTRLEARGLYAMVKANLTVASLVEENESAAVSADFMQLLLGAVSEDAEERQPFGTAHARLASGAPARMSEKVRSLARQALALRATRERNPEDPEQWAARITKSIYGE